MENGLGSNNPPYEYAIKKKVDTKIKLQRTGLILFYFIWVVSFVLIGVKTVLVAPFIALIPISLWVIIHFTWRLTCIEYEFSIYAGEFSITYIYNERKRKEKFRCKIKDFQLICPYNDEYSSRVASFQPDKSIYAISSLQAKDLYLLTYQDENDKKWLICMEINEKAQKLLQYYNRTAFRGKEINHENF